MTGGDSESIPISQNNEILPTKEKKIFTKVNLNSSFAGKFRVTEAIKKIPFLRKILYSLRPPALNFY